MRPIKFFFISLLIILPITLFAGTNGKIAGLVVDKSSGEPLPGVNVIIKGTLLGAATDIDGSYFIVNIPVGTYSLEITYVGYKNVIVNNVRIQADLTTSQDIKLEPSLMELGEQIVITAERPIIQRDLTASRDIMTSDEIKDIPVENVQGIVALSAGFVDGHARGGRDGEVRYQIDGVSAVDPMTGGFDTDVPEMAIEEVSVIKSGFSAEYSNAQSGIVNIVMKEGRKDNYTGKVQYKTSNFGDFDGYKFNESTGQYESKSGLSDMHRLKNLEWAFGGPIPLLKSVTFHLSGEHFFDEGRTPNSYQHNNTYSGKFAISPSQRDKITFSGTFAWSNTGSYSHLWSRKTYEDNLANYIPIETNPSPLDSWYGNGQLDTEDKNGNGVLDLNEDLNFNGILDTEDLNNDGKLTTYDMLDHLRYNKSNSYNISGNWTHTINNKSFIQWNIGVYKTKMVYDVNEKINEDANRNGILDLEWDKNGNGILDIDEDANLNGQWDYEDLNGNGILDTGADDMFNDDNNNGIIDESELSDQALQDYLNRGGDPDRLFMHWEDLPFGSEKDKDGYFVYGAGNAYYRLRWNNDDKITYSSKFLYKNQINKEHFLKVGVEGKLWDIYDHDVDLASGGNVYGQNIGERDDWGAEGQKAISPYTIGAFVEDKMEFEDFIVNMGLRYDIFDPNWDDFPGDMSNPVVDETHGGEVKNPVQVGFKKYFSPRLGVAFPISERDRFFFNYGKMFQLPIFSLLYRNINWDFSGAFPMVGNPDIMPETTIYYEIGVEHQIGLDWKVKAVGYYKDIKGLTDTKRYFFTSSNYYSIYYNTDYGKIEGFELTLNKRISNYFGGFINYTYQIAVGKSSSSAQNYRLIWAGTIVPKEESYLDWDQRHTMNTNIYFQTEDNAPFGFKPLKNVNINMIAQYGSGLPYSPSQRTREVLINTERGLPTYNIDISIKKSFKFKRYILSAFIWINNLTDHINIRNYRDMDIEWYQVYGDTNKDGKVGMDDDYDKVLRAARGRYNNPAYNSEGRRYKVGLSLSF
ncbi:MAG: carboxypeptidase-like regulatory domain-containing protein [Bacteroidetes bacterium]|nr:carboxypeptidase-like regulatory domain-containing protein [Bacteroidota bacterium]